MVRKAFLIFGIIGLLVFEINIKDTSAYYNYGYSGLYNTGWGGFDNTGWGGLYSSGWGSSGNTGWGSLYSGGWGCLGNTGWNSFGNTGWGGLYSSGWGGLGNTAWNSSGNAAGWGSLYNSGWGGLYSSGWSGLGNSGWNSSGNTGWGTGSSGGNSNIQPSSNAGDVSREGKGSTPVALGPADPIISEIHQLINEYRTSNGLSTLSYNEVIAQQAQKHSEDMASQKVEFSHEGFSERIDEIGKVIHWSSAAENIDYNMGYSDPGEVAVEGWLNSPGHKKNIEGDYNLTGIGMGRDQSGGYYFTQIFILSR